MLVGILALQGDFFAHASALSDLSVDARYIRNPLDLDGIEGLIIPGGESTVMSLLVQSSGLYAPLIELLESGLPVLATCAGVIMLSREIVDGRDDQISFGALDVSIERNGYGRQLQSFETDIPLYTGSFHAVFIRAPRILKVGPDVEVLATIPSHPLPSHQVPSNFILNRPTLATVPSHPLPSATRPRHLDYSCQAGAAAADLQKVGGLQEIGWRGSGDGQDNERIIGEGIADEGRAGRDSVDVVMCRQGPILACTFHPELTPDRRVHSIFVDQVKRSRIQW